MINHAWSHHNLFESQTDGLKGGVASDQSERSIEVNVASLNPYNDVYIQTLISFFFTTSLIYSFHSRSGFCCLFNENYSNPLFENSTLNLFEWHRVQRLIDGNIRERPEPWFFGGFLFLFFCSSSDSAGFPTLCLDGLRKLWREEGAKCSVVESSLPSGTEVTDD